MLFSFSNKVFYPLTYIMNGLQLLTIPTSLKFCPVSCIMIFIWPQLLKIWPQLSPDWPQLFSFGERAGDNFFRPRANPVMSKISTNGDTIIQLSRKHCGKGRNCLLLTLSQTTNFTFFQTERVCSRQF